MKQTTKETTMKEHEALEQFDEYLNTNGEDGLIHIGYLSYEISHVLKNVDPVAYHQEFLKMILPMSKHEKAKICLEKAIEPQQ
jgi:hypothetical protein